MPGLISSNRYSESKGQLCQDNAGAEDAVDALEWRLMHSVSLEAFPPVPEDAQPKGKAPVRSIVVDPSPHRPGVVGVFTIEAFGGDDKILLLDVWITEDDDE